MRSGIVSTDVDSSYFISHDLSDLIQSLKWYPHIPDAPPASFICNIHTDSDIYSAHRGTFCTCNRLMLILLSYMLVYGKFRGLIYNL